MKLCIACKHYDEKSGAYGWYCARTPSIDPVTGKTVGHRRNDVERDSWIGLLGGCGPRAKYFEEKEPT